MNAESSTDICLVDSNVWLYIFLPGQDTEKANAARELVRSKDDSIVLSTQIINEVVVNLIKNAVLSESEIRELIRRFYARFTVRSVVESSQLNASKLREKYSLSHWDSLIVSVALESGAVTLYSEDMQEGLVVEGKLKLVNPFAVD